ncbi:hypothetical protein FA13DRAFT_1645125, partial [Coprinellus micaceus]
KIGSITMDNASNNNTLMEAFEKALVDLNVPFHRDGNRIRSPEWHTYLAALESDLIARVRKLVAACRVSSQRRQDLQRIIAEGNDKCSWRGKKVHRYLGEDANCPTLRLLQLLRDRETRWSSVYLMIDRFLYLYPAVRELLLDRRQSDLPDCLLTDRELGVLLDIHQILEVGHKAQELLSGERTPALSVALPSYEVVVIKWRQLQKTIPKMAPFIEKGIEKIESYMNESRKTRIYAHAMGESHSMAPVYCDLPVCSS